MGVPFTSTVPSAGVRSLFTSRKIVLFPHPEALNHPFYGDWVSGYVADAYHEENQVLIDLMDRLSDGYSEKQLQHLEEIFMACSRYEMAFWDMAWEMRR